MVVYKTFHTTKIIDGSVYEIPLGYGKTVEFDTSKLTIIACGAFSNIAQKVDIEKPIGFGTEIKKRTFSNMGVLTEEDFIKYGLKPEFVGRFNSFIGLNSLTKEDQIKILKESKKSPIRVYESIFEKMGLNLKLSDETYAKIVEKGMKKNTGARGPKAVVSTVFSELIYDMIDNINEEIQVDIDPNIVDNPKLYKLKINNLSKE